MAKQTINIGTAPNDGTGTPLRTAFDYCNLNFTELYTAVGPSGNNIVVPGTATITGNLTVDTNTLFVDAANNYVGVGTVTPLAQFFSTLNATGVAGRLNTNTIGSAIAASYQTAGITNGTLPFGIRCTGNAFAGISGQLYASQIVTESTAALALEIFNTGNTPIVFGVNGAESMRLNSTGLGVGGVPSGVNRFAVWNGATQALTLDTSGNLLVGKTSASVTTVGFQTLPSGEASVAMAATTGAATTLNVYSTGAAAYRFFVGMNGTVSATNATISAISDARFKENIQDLDVGLGAILALKPRKFDWKSGKGKDIKGDRGFIAQEFEQVFPNLVDEWRDNAPEGEAPYKSVRADLIPVLVKAIQELTARVQTLEAK
jgi:hypothetical protein